MCICTLKKQKFGLSVVKDTAKTNKDLGMSRYIQAEYSVFPRWYTLKTIVLKNSTIKVLNKFSTISANIVLV